MVYACELLMQELPEAKVSINIEGKTTDEIEYQGIKQEAFMLGIVPYPD